MACLTERRAHAEHMRSSDRLVDTSTEHRHGLVKRSYQRRQTSDNAVPVRPRGQERTRRTATRATAAHVQCTVLPRSCTPCPPVRPSAASAHIPCTRTGARFPVSEARALQSALGASPLRAGGVRGADAPGGGESALCSASCAQLHVSRAALSWQAELARARCKVNKTTKTRGPGLGVRTERGVNGEGGRGWGTKMYN